MEQEKIGKFIAECRKNHKLTQEELGEKMGVSSKTISRWETGRCMPDISLLEPLSIELEVTINELIKGHKISDKNIKKETDDNLKKSLNETQKSRKNVKLLTIIIIFLLIFVIIISLNKRISLASFKAMNTSRNFYQLLKTNDYKKIASSITKKYEEDMWHTTATNYTTQDFIDNLKTFKEDGIKYKSFRLMEFDYDGTYFVKYKMCFQDKKEEGCVSIKVLNGNGEDGKYIFWVEPLGEESEFERRIVNVFNPVWYIEK